ncbi:hypothetical protein LVD17_08950 [Fulvivirga ulvae]|uniref:hypothetical protein n=1 Tax=Fulvivirga ulvae TaxID=2904245 RepID=UPI001F16CB59|nr:hypothetical protein [Fulvivirga ulvae]UII33941.1 hypothetical protein LVD17_08950 [Fulvivirga ulvae]
MEGIFIFSKAKKEEKFIQDLTLAGFRMRAYVRITGYYYRGKEYSSSEIVIEKDYYSKDKERLQEYLRFYIGEDTPVIEEYQGDKVYCLGSNDGGTDCEHLLLDWCIEYLKINPDHLIVSVDENVYSQEHLLKAKERNEFYWMYKAPEELLR